MAFDYTRKVFIAMPTDDGRVRMTVVTAVFNEMLDLLVAGFPPQIEPYGELRPIHNARNRAIKEFYESDCSDLIFWDDDVVPEAGAVSRLLRYDVDFVAGVTPHKGDKLSFPIRLEPNQRRITETDNGLITVGGVPFGLVRLSRRCVTRLFDAYGHLHYNMGAIPGGALRLFSFDLEPDANGVPEERSEDFMFCKRWVDIGGSIHVDARMKFAHIGDKAYTGSLDEWLRTNPATAAIYHPRAIVKAA